MAVSAAEARFLDSISLDAPWSLVEAFSTMPRWRPEDVNAGADHIASVLTRLGVPVTVHEPEIYLSIPLRAEVRVGGETYRAKPPSMSISAPAGIEGGLVHLETDPNTYRSYTRDPSEIFAGEGGDVRARVKGKVVVMAGFANPGSCSPPRGVGGEGRDRGQPRRRHPLGHLHDDLGLARPRRPAAQAAIPSSPSTIRTGRRSSRRRAPAKARPSSPR